jgi:hypothetical protein
METVGAPVVELPRAAGPYGPAPMQAAGAGTGDAEPSFEQAPNTMGSGVTSGGVGGFSALEAAAQPARVPSSESATSSGQAVAAANTILLFNTAAVHHVPQVSGQPTAEQGAGPEAGGSVAAAASGSTVEQQGVGGATPSSGSSVQQ